MSRVVPSNARLCTSAECRQTNIVRDRDRPVRIDRFREVFQLPSRIGFGLEETVNSTLFDVFASGGLNIGHRGALVRQSETTIQR